MPNGHGAEYEAKAIDDGYDPRKLEYIIPVTEDEVKHTSTELLGRQILKLEVLLEKRQAESNCQTYHHYEQVIAEMRYEASRRAGKSESSHFRMRSDPAKQPKEPLNSSSRTFTHARTRSAPAPASSCDIVPPDPEPPHANRVHGSRPLRSPGEELAARNVSTYSTLLGPSVRPVARLLSMLVQGASPQRGTTPRRRPSTPPVGKAMGPRPGHVQSTNFIGGLCGDLAD